MHTREFTKHDWMGFAGAESWTGGEPLIACGRLANGREYEVVFDATGANLYAGDEYDEFGGWILRLPFPSQEAARAFARGIGCPRNTGEFEELGFCPADESVGC